MAADSPSVGLIRPERRAEAARRWLADGQDCQVKKRCSSAFSLSGYRFAEGAQEHRSLTVPHRSEGAQFEYPVDGKEIFTR